MLHHCVKLRLTLRGRQWGAGAAAARGIGGSDPVLFHALKHGLPSPPPTPFFFLFPFPLISLGIISL